MRGSKIMKSYHSQNLTDDRLPTWRHGRAWWRRWRAEWSVFHQPKFHIGIEKGGYAADGRGVHMTICLWVFSLYLTYTTKRLHVERDLSIYWHEGSLWISPWIDNGDAFNRALPWYRKMIVLHVGDWILGEAKFSSEKGHPIEVLIPMPEGCYPATFTPTTRRWKRRFSETSNIGHDIDIPGGIPFEGKGENSWDCGEDGLYGCGATGSVERGVAHVVETVMKYRRQYGGSYLHRGRFAILARTEGEHE